MPNTLNLRPHPLVKSKGSVVVGGTPDPYVCLRQAGSLEVFVQRGCFFWAGGEEIAPSEVPDWVLDSLKNLTPAVRKEVGLAPIEETKKR